jgi:hypothetical protein
MFNRVMSRVSALWIGVLLLGGNGLAQELAPLPKTIPGVVNIPHLNQSPTKMVKPVYPPEALQRWVQATIVLDAVLDSNGDVETLGCDVICKDVREDMVQAAATAVRQWKWNPVLLKGNPVRVRTRVSVEFVLDETSPAISVCNLFHDPAWYAGRVVNVSGIAQKQGGLPLLVSKDCAGSLVIAMNGDATPPIEDAKYAALEQSLLSGVAAVSLRGLIHDDRGVGQLAGQRLVLQRVLRCAPE